MISNDNNKVAIIIMIKIVLKIRVIIVEMIIINSNNINTNFTVVYDYIQFSKKFITFRYEFKKYEINILGLK
jgi:hypothetical protein